MRPEISHAGPDVRPGRTAKRVFRPGRTSGICLALILACFAFSASSASAAEPWWHVNTVSAPASQPGGEGRLLLEVSNLGDAAVDGFTDPVTIVDQLPAGVHVEHVYGEGGGSPPIGQNGVKELLHCGVVGQTVTCTYAGPLLAYERFMVAMTVSVEAGAGGGVSEVSVTGGGAPPVVSRHALALGETPAAFGAENYELTPEEEGGEPDTQAGSHPFQLTTTLTFDSKAVPVSKVIIEGDPAEVLPEVQPVGLTKDLRFTLPPGLVGNPTPLPKCRLSVFVHPSTTSRCPADTVIGVATPIVTNTTEAFVPLAETVSLYSLEPAEGEPARFGFTTPVGPIVLDTSVQPGSNGNYTVVVTVPDIPDDLPFIGTQVTFWGVPGDSRHDTARGECLDQFEGGDIHHITKLETSCTTQEKPQPFLIMPSSCTGPLQTGVQGDSWENIGQYTAPKQYTFADSEGNPIAQDGCNRLSFEPSISVAPDSQQASTPTGLTVGVHVDQEASLNPTGLADATVKDTTVTLPAGIGLNPSAADGLSACSTGEIALESAAEQTCPESSKVATVKIKTPLLASELEGSAYLAAQNANPFGSLLALYLVVYNPESGVRVKLAGEVQPNPDTGQLVSTFKETPQLPFEDLSIHFFGGSRAPLGTPVLCGSYTTVASISPWSANPAVESSSTFDVTSGPEVQTPSGPVRTPCASPLPFSPSLTGGALNLQAGAFSPFTLTMTRKPGEQNLQSVEAKLPPGLSGVLSNIELCPEPQANQGECGASSLVGETTISVGLGGDPFTVSGGRFYLTGPYNGSGACTVGESGCAPFGLTFEVPAKAGPFDLERNSANPAGEDACDCVIVRGKIEIDPTTAALTITSNPPGTPDSIPTSIEGIPLEIQHVNAITTRGDFQFNPTNCSKMEVTGTIHSSEHGTDKIGVPFQVTNCASLGFKPKFTASTEAKDSFNDYGASLSVHLTANQAPNANTGIAAEADIAKVKVELPGALPSRLTTLQKACLAKVFEANPANCPPDSFIGHAVVHTPILPVPLEGPAIFVSHGGEAFPSLILVLQGYGVTIDLTGATFISKAGVTSSTFKTVPDQPFSSFELTLPTGKFSALAALTNVCKPTKTETVKKKVAVKRHGKTVKVTKKVSEVIAAPLLMPTEMVAQNGAVLTQSTKIAVTGCKAAKPAKKKKAKARKKAKSKGKKK
jgi:hypothetical protein